MFNKLLLLSLISIVFSVHAGFPITTMPNDFVKLSNVAPNIIQSQRYASSENFLGRPVPGYRQTGIYCTRQAAIALKKVSAALNKQGYALVVYDAYRPQRAVNAFVAWSKATGDQVGKSKYYPSISKNKLFDQGYLLEQSGHSRGSTIDLTIIPLNQALKSVVVSARHLKNGETIPFLDDNTVDMGSSFDLFHPVSHHGSLLITDEQTRMRTLLRETMKTYGFEEIEEEWWHYTLVHEPYPNTYFDFMY